MLEDAKKLAQKLKLDAKDFSGIQDQSGKVVPALEIKQGRYTLYAIELNSSIKLMLQIDIDPKDAALLGKQPPEIQRDLIAILRREMLEGRTGYELNTPDGKLLGIRLSQNLIISDENSSAQRLLDAIQEIIVVTCRCLEVLGQSFGSMRQFEEICKRTYNDGMYR